MRVLIQNCHTFKFLGEKGQWVDSADDAAEFAGSVAALDYIREHRLDHGQIVLKFDQPEHDLVLKSHTVGC